MSSSKFSQLSGQSCMHYHSICIIIKTSYITHLHLQPSYLIHIACQCFVYVLLLKTNLGLCRYKIQTIEETQDYGELFVATKIDW